MELQLYSYDFLVIPKNEVWVAEFLSDFMIGYEQLINNRNSIGLPVLDDVIEYAQDFFYELVSFYEFDGDTSAYYHLLTDEGKADFYETANEKYFWPFFVDVNNLVKRKHISLYRTDEGYLNMPISEVW